MPTPVVEQIAVKVKTRLEAITTGNGYELSVSGVVRPKRIDETSPANNQIYLTQETATTVAVYQGNPAKHEWRQPFRIALGLRPSETDSTAMDTHRNTFFADVQKALAQPTSGEWSQWDGLAMNSNLGSAEWFLDDEGAEGGLHLILDVFYRVPENDPYTVAA